MSTLGVAALGTAPLAGGSVRAAPTLSGVTATVSAGLKVTGAWTYNSTVGRAQDSYRLIVYTAVYDTLTDTGWVSGTDASAEINYVLPTGSLILSVQVSDGVDLSAVTEVNFTVTGGDPSLYSDEPRVGSVFEVAINGVGYMLADDDRRPVRRQVVSMQAPRFATDDTDFSEAIDRYTMVGQSSWAGGAGQKLGDRDGSDGTRFDESVGVDVFNLDGGIRLLDRTEKILSNTNTNSMAVVAGDDLWVVTGTNEVTRYQWGGTTSTSTLSGATIVDMCSDGEYAYVADSAGKIWRGNAGTAFASWSTLAGVETVDWTSDRITATYQSGGAVKVSTLGPSGTEEVSGGRFSFDDGTVPAATAGDGYMWFGVNRNNEGTVYAWGLGSSDSRFVALELPSGQSVRALEFYLGNVILIAAEPLDATATSEKLSVYRCIPAAGELVPELITTLTTAVSSKIGIAGAGRLVVFGLASDSLNSSRSTLIALDLSTGGWARHLAALSGSGGDVASVFVWKNLVGFTEAGEGTWFQDDGVKVASGWLTSSVRDLGSGLVKVLDEWLVSSEPLPSGAEIDLEVSTSGGTAWTAVGTIDAGGATSSTLPIATEGSSVKLRTTLNSDAGGTLDPVLLASQIKLHPLSMQDVVLELPVNTSERVTGLNGVEISGQGSSMERVRRLMALTGTRVRVQDVDWPTTQQGVVWELVAVDSTSTGAFDRSVRKRVERGSVSVLTLRRAL